MLARGGAGACGFGAGSCAVAIPSRMGAVSDIASRRSMQCIVFSDLVAEAASFGELQKQAASATAQSNRFTRMFL